MNDYFARDPLSGMIVECRNVLRHNTATDEVSDSKFDSQNPANPIDNYYVFNTRLRFPQVVFFLVWRVKLAKRSSLKLKNVKPRKWRYLLRNR